MDFFYFSHVQEVSCKEYLYYYSAALSNMQICISFARPGNLCKELVVHGNDWTNTPLFPCGENESMWFFMLVPLDCLPLVPELWWLVDTGGDVHYGSLSPLVDKVQSTRLIFLRVGRAVDLDHRNMTAYGEGAGVSRSPPSPGLQIGWAGRSLLLCSCMKRSPPRSWLRHDSVFIQARLPVKQIAFAFALSLHR